MILSYEDKLELWLEEQESLYTEQMIDGLLNLEEYNALMNKIKQEYKDELNAVKEIGMIL
jgi:hypothetical protein